MSMHWEKLCAPNIWLNIRGMGGVGLISPLEFLQLQLVIGFLDLLVQSAQISLYSLQTCIPHKRGKAAPAPEYFSQFGEGPHRHWRPFKKRLCRLLQVILSMHRSDVVKIYYFLVTRAQKGKGKEGRRDLWHTAHHSVSASRFSGRVWQGSSVAFKVLRFIKYIPWKNGSFLSVICYSSNAHNQKYGRSVLSTKCK